MVVFRLVNSATTACPPGNTNHQTDRTTMTPLTQMPDTTSSMTSDARSMEDDGVVPNETLIVSPMISAATAPEKWPANGPDPRGVVEKDAGPPDGGYGWVVVGYGSCFLGNNSAIFVLNAFTWGINAVRPLLAY